MRKNYENSGLLQSINRQSGPAQQLGSAEEILYGICKAHGNTLVRLYADEGISGTKVKKRKQFLQMMADAETGLFEHVVVRIFPALLATPSIYCRISER